MATGTSTKGLLEQVGELQAEALSFEEEARSLQEKAQVALSRRNQALGRIHELSGSPDNLLDLNAAQVAGSSLPQRQGPSPKRRGPSPNGSQTQTPKAVSKKAKTTGKTSRNYDNPMSLTETIWEILDREPANLKKHIPSYDVNNPDGLKVAEVRDIIESEGTYKSSSSNISPMIQQQFQILRHEGKIARSNSESRRNYIVEGAELFGPPLNPDGSKMKEQADGTFLTKEGKVFMKLQMSQSTPPKPWKLHRKGKEE